MIDFNAVKNLNLKVEVGQTRYKRTVGILNKGMNNTFKNNTFSKLDVGILDEGKNTSAEGNRFE